MTTEQDPGTGIPEVDAALAPLASLGDRPVAEHAAVLEDVHARLAQLLTDPASAAPTDPADASPEDERPAPGRPAHESAAG